MSQSLVERVGALIKNMPFKHSTEYKVQFNLQENTVFQKLISVDVIEKGVRIKPEQYFRGLIFLTYFTDVIENDHQVCDNLVAISKNLREEEKKRNLNSSASYLEMDFVMLETGLGIHDHGDGHYIKEKTAIKARYAACAGEISLDRQVDPYYVAIGKMVYDMVSDQHKSFLEKVCSRSELGALIFVDSILGVLKNADEKGVIEEHLSRCEYLGASIAAAEALGKGANIDDAEGLFQQALYGNKDPTKTIIDSSKELMMNSPKDKIKELLITGGGDAI